jgi:hypothetical protein
MSCVRFGATNVHLQWHVSQSDYHRSSCVQSVLDARCCRCGCGTDPCNIANEGLANTLDIFAGFNQSNSASRQDAFSSVAAGEHEPSTVMM